MSKKWVYDFSIKHSDGDSSMRNILGSKGANLAEMCKLGINVPPGCTIISDACNYYLDNNQTFPEELKLQVRNSIRIIEEQTNTKFDDVINPLLVSIRSGARSSMPGMMDTILNLGLNDKNVEALASKTNNPRFAYDSYRRFIQMYSNVVLGIDEHYFEEIIDRKKEELGIYLDLELKTNDFKELIKLYKAKIFKLTSKEFPENLEEQLWSSISAVFTSWMNPRAITYRKMNNIPDDFGTAVNIQAMVFGNMGNDSLTGVVFTRSPSDGEKILFGEYLVNAQGEDIVAGIRTPEFITTKLKEANKSDQKSMEESMNHLYLELQNIANKLETHYRDMQDIEFTVQENKLWILQTRSGKRTPKASINIAVDMVEEGLITKKEALLRIDSNSLDQLLHPTIDTNFTLNVIAKGLPASPGAASGIVVFNTKDAEIKASLNQKVILVRTQTSPEDIGGMYASEGILTSRGGMTSHAAVIARGMGKACVCGAGEIIIDYKNKTLEANGTIVKEGELITINGSTGDVILGMVPTINADLSENFQILLNWADEFKKLQVRANSETINDTNISKMLGAEGIGLCRTEHMFFSEDRIDIVREMIIAKDAEERKKPLKLLLSMQIEDFTEILKIMDQLPVTIRLLDPPLHEFLPINDDEVIKLANKINSSVDSLKLKIDNLTEHNPMLGHRGCRIGISHPEIYEMQVEAIFLSMFQLLKKNLKPIVEIMIPFVISREELAIIKKLINNVAEKVNKEHNINLEYKIGTMIELPKAALTADNIANDAEFFSFGTNDLTQTTLGISRDDSSSFIETYIDKNILKSDPFIELDLDGVGALIKIAVNLARTTKPDIKIGVCGEQSVSNDAIRFFKNLKFDYISCSPFRIPIVKLIAAQIEIENENNFR